MVKFVNTNIGLVTLHSLLLQSQVSNQFSLSSMMKTLSVQVKVSARSYEKQQSSCNRRIWSNWQFHTGMKDMTIAWSDLWMPIFTFCQVLRAVFIAFSLQCVRWFILYCFQHP